MRLLYIAHRIPYPPNKGDKIRSFNELAFLSKRFDVDLVCFYGGPGEQEYIAKLQGMCKTVSAFRRTLWGQPLRLIAGLLFGVPASVALYRNIPMRRKISRLIAEHDYAHVFVFSGQMAQYVPRELLGRTVMDFCDVDSHKWDNYADRLPFYLAWFYRLEARRLLAFEKAASEAARACILITPAELELYRRLGGSGRLLCLGNGVDTEYFRPGEGGFEEGRILFTGAMDYFPNEEGVAWFARDVFPFLRKKFPKARFVIAGSNPSLKVRALARIDGVEVTGFVQDMRVEQTRAHVVVVPLRIARGMQNKVLEAMACGKAVVVHPKAMGGVHAENGRDLFVAEQAQEFLAAVELLLGDPARVRAMGAAAREYILENFSWERNLAKGLLPLLPES
jgi:sugar transferase (PEP-CTERM/EpsH1 system associated)